MSDKKSNNMGVIVMAVLTAVGAFFLIIFPNLLTGAMNVVAWAAVGVAGTTAGAMKYSQIQKEKEIKTKALEKSRQKRRLQREAERRAQEERLEKAQKVTERKEEIREAKQEKIKAEMIEKAEVVWESREHEAEKQEKLARKIIANTLDMNIRTVAGYVAVEWNEASRMAKWTAEQLIMFARRPNVTTKARDEAREAEIEAEEIRASGNSLSPKQGNELKMKKKKAQEEIKMEEMRLKEVYDILDNAEIKWRGVEMRVNRRQRELDNLLKKSVFTKKAE